MAVRATEVSASRFSVVVPVFNSSRYLASTIEAIVQVFERSGRTLELILINDGSSDSSWQIIVEKANTDPRIIGIDLLRNFGQQSAVLCGLSVATGDYVITMDDDLQTPVDQIEKLIQAAAVDTDVVYGKYEVKQAPFYRYLGSRIVRQLNKTIFHQTADLELTSFRFISRDVVDRIVSSGNPFPYIDGEILKHSASVTHTVVRHDPRQYGKSNYTYRRLLGLMATIIFSYSHVPLRAVSAVGVLGAIGGFIFGSYSVSVALISGSDIQGWASLAALLSFFSGAMILMIAIVGEYVLRIMKSLMDKDPYIVRQTVGDAR
jgi:glycosyltransferase involved in cell wall biosynthesis